ncbi:MAG: hypothetical protein F6K54_20105 [Okeania sp. SIO3B5]|uniref:hypothetical protein n=1 Tax=Okeania sp. SIO3B5 TaxID=2607811 RepID=UPI001400D6AA|nr:hypothetical protein [Okeania sp. SIO3B5]NEO55176.1 hypothetical protein [Okeania sp. SIO3B5]
MHHKIGNWRKSEAKKFVIVYTYLIIREQGTGNREQGTGNSKCRRFSGLKNVLTNSCSAIAVEGKVRADQKLKTQTKQYFSSFCYTSKKIVLLNQRRTIATL